MSAATTRMFRKYKKSNAITIKIPLITEMQWALVMNNLHNLKVM